MHLGKKEDCVFEWLVVFSVDDVVDPPPTRGSHSCERKVYACQAGLSEEFKVQQWERVIIVKG